MSLVLPTRMRKGQLHAARRKVRDRWRTDRRTRSATGAQQLTLLLDEVDQHVVAEGLGRREERPALVQLRELLDETLEAAVGIEHERVDPDPVLGAAGHLG